MKQYRIIICLLVLSGFWLKATNAQEAIPATGGNASGTGGSLSYTIGQVEYSFVSGTKGTVNHGVQQPFEISVVTEAENRIGISLECFVYPNPTAGSLKLVIESAEVEIMRFRLYNFNGVLLKDQPILNRETEISLEEFASSVYFIKVFIGNIEVKVFKIVRK